MSTKRNKIGIITGQNPIYGINLWQEIVKENIIFLNNHYKGDLDNPELVIFSLPHLDESIKTEGAYNKDWKIIENTINEILLHVDYFCFSCTFLNSFKETIFSLGYGDVFISLEDVLIEYLKKHQIQKVAILDHQSNLEVSKYCSYKSLIRNFELEPIDELAKLKNIIKISTQDEKEAKYAAQKLANIIENTKCHNIIIGPIEASLLSLEEFDKNFILTNNILAKKLAIKSFYG